MTDPIRVHKRTPKPSIPPVESVSKTYPYIARRDPLFLLIFGAAGLVFLGLSIWVPIEIHREKVSRKASQKWCVDHGYVVANISQTTGGGKTQMRIDQVVCMDDQRRMILPGE